MDFEEAGRLGFGLSLIALLFFVHIPISLASKKLRERRNRSRPYRVFTRDYDLTVRPDRAVAGLDDDSLDGMSGHLQGADAWSAAVERAKLLHSVLETEPLPVFPTAPCGATIAFLIDQSGSMQGDPMEHAAAAVRAVAQALLAAGWRVEILGFSTAGWQGGHAYRHWLSMGRPAYPGRVCALRHIIYRAAMDGDFDEVGWEAMLHPALLRENVDGEALSWATGRLRDHDGAPKILIVLSDGAPVDDATILANGHDEGLLPRHLRSVIQAIEQDGDIRLAALGISYRVGEFYSCNEIAETPDAIFAGLARLTRYLIIEQGS